ncbi:MAG: EutN/CcmL family microcompartment protein [Streptococcaceae bacterium]|jgi:ethanolamine utilization protein EutN|nr:EutN/CcmL family microcompartment protein [Streptococcaceae bacterium]
MILGRVTGNIWSTRKNEKLTGLKFMIVERLTPEKTPMNDFLIAADSGTGAGIGDNVLVVTGSSARLAANPEVPIDAMIVGVVDAGENIENK